MDNHAEQCKIHWSDAKSISDVCKLMISWLKKEIPSMHSTKNIEFKDDYVQKLIRINSNNILTTRSQLGGVDKDIYRRNYIEFNIDQTRITGMLELLKDSDVIVVITIDADHVYFSESLYLYKKYIVSINEDFYSHYVIKFPDVIKEESMTNLHKGLIMLERDDKYNSIKSIDLTNKNMRKPIEFIQCDQYYVFNDELKNAVQSMALVTVIDPNWHNTTYAIDFIAAIANHIDQ